MMKKLACVLLFSLMATSTFAMPEYRTEMQERLKASKKLSFDFESGIAVGRVLGLFENYFGNINIIYDPKVDQDKEITIDTGFNNGLVTFEKVLLRANLQYQVVGPNTIKILPK